MAHYGIDVHVEAEHTFELPHVKTNKMILAPSEDSDQSDQSLRCALNR